MARAPDRHHGPLPASYLQQTPAEVDALFRDLLIGVTSFFRDPEAFAAVERAGHSEAPGRQTGGRADPCLVARLLHRRGGVLHRHAVRRAPGGDEADLPGPGLRHRHRRRGHCHGARGSLSGQHRHRRLTRAAGAVLCGGARRQRLPHPQDHSRHGGLLRAGRDQGPSVLEARSRQLSQRPHLHGQRAAEEADAPVPLHAEPGRVPLPGNVGDRGRRGRSVHRAGSQAQALPAPGGHSPRPAAAAWGRFLPSASDEEPRPRVSPTSTRSARRCRCAS